MKLFPCDFRLHFIFMKPLLKTPQSYLLSQEHILVLLNSEQFHKRNSNVNYELKLDLSQLLPSHSPPPDSWENEKRQCVHTALVQWLPQITGSLTKAVVPLTCSIKREDLVIGVSHMHLPVNNQRLKCKVTGFREVVMGI